jgi:type IX secretion system PorP/SprF family membrane protein
MISLGLAGASVARSIDFSKLTWDRQWDGETFNPTLPNGELAGIRKTRYMDVSAGVNYAFFPNENLYMKVGVGATHLNTPKESFYNMVNQLGIRPTANIDVLFKAGAAMIVNPSVYYTQQRSAYQLVYGSNFDFLLATGEAGATRLLIGAYHRLGDAIIGMAGIDISGMRITGSYDATTSELGKYNGGKGAFELSFSYSGLYGNSGSRKTWNCPRF